MVALAEEVTDSAEQPTGHRRVLVHLAGLDGALLSSPVRLSTMGRGLDGDPAYFLAAAASGRLAAQLVG